MKTLRYGLFSFLPLALFSSEFPGILPVMVRQGGPPKGSH